MPSEAQNRRQEDPGLTTWLTLLHAHSLLLDVIEADLQASAGLPLGWFEVLAQLSGAPEGRLTMQELAHSVLLSKSGVTRLVDRMEAAGLVARMACPTDRRAIWTVLTEDGRNALRAALPVARESVARHVSGNVTASELAMLHGILQKILGAHGFTPPPCPTTVEALDSANESRKAPVG